AVDLARGRDQLAATEFSRHARPGAGHPVGREPDGAARAQRTFARSAAEKSRAAEAGGRNIPEHRRSRPAALARRVEPAGRGLAAGGELVEATVPAAPQLRSAGG